MTDKHTCDGAVYDRYVGWHACGATASIERNGKWYCKRHDPIAVAERDAKRQAVSDANWNALKTERRLDAARKHFCHGLDVEYMETHLAKKIIEGWYDD